MILKSNERIVIKRDNTPGVVPTIPSSNDHTDGTWVSTDIYVGEFFMNVADDKLWYRSDNGINLISYSGTTIDFVDLTDVPNSYIGEGLKTLRVNSAETAIEFYDLTQVTNTLELTDMPLYGGGSAGYNLVVNSAGTGYELSANVNTFIGLTDTPTGYTGYANYGVIVNSDETGLTFFDTSILVTKTGNNGLTGDNVFSGLTYFYDYVYFTDMVIGAIKISEFSTTITSASTHAQLATSKSVFDYVDNLSALSGLSNVAFNDIDNNFTSIQTFQDIQLGSSNSYYIGDTDTDGSWRFSINGDGALQFEKRISGVWTVANIIDVI